MWSFADAFPLLAASDSTGVLANEPATPEQAERALATLLRHLEDSSNLPLRDVLPGLENFGRRTVDRSAFGTRAANTLVRLGVVTWADLGDISLDSIRSLPSVGATTVEEIATKVILQSVSEPEPDRDADLASEDSNRGSLADKQLVDFARKLALWARLETDAQRLSDVLGVTRPLPTDLEREWSRVGEWKLESVSAPSSTVPELVDLLLADFEPTWRRILDKRVLAAEPMKLRELGEDLGITRERVRQIQVKVEQRLRYRLSLPEFTPVVWRAESVRRTLGTAAPVDDERVVGVLAEAVVGGEQQDEIRSLLLYAAGPYEVRDGWLCLAEANLPAAGSLTDLADQDGLIELHAVTTWLAERGIRPAFAEAWLTEKAKAEVANASVIPRWPSVVDRCVARLALRGEPTTADELVAEVGEGHNAKGVRNRFFEDDRLMRVNKSQWALRRWGLEEYTGIADEILQRINEHGGRVALEWLVGELVALFQVAEGSVRAYAAAPMFVIEDGYVRCRQSDEPYEVRDDISGCGGVFWHAGQLVMQLVVDKDALRGSGRTLAPAIAARLGVGPGRPRAFAHDGGEVVVTWPETAALGPSLGSVRSLLAAIGASDGERIALRFDTGSGMITAQIVPPLAKLAPDQALAVLTGIDSGEDVEAEIARAIDASKANVRQVLAARGDDDVLSRLGAPAVDSALEAALAELAGALGDVD